MLKHLFIAVLAFLLGVAGNLFAAWIQPDVEALSGQYRLIGVIIGVAVTIVVVTFLESERALPLNWRWHRFWYLLDLQSYYRRRLNIGHPNGMISNPRSAPIKDQVVAEVVIDRERQNVVSVLYAAIAKRQGWSCHILLLGEPGSGKSVALEQLTRAVAQKGSRRFGFGSPIPVLVRLAEYRQGTLLNHIRRQVQLVTKGRSGRALSKGLEDLLKKSRIVLLFDGLDETAAGLRDTVILDIKEFATPAYGNTAFIITARLREVQPAEFDNLEIQTLHIQELSDSAITTLIRVYKRYIVDPRICTISTPAFGRIVA